MKQRAFLVCLVAQLTLSPALALEPLALPRAAAATCSQLGEVAYWAATAHLSMRDKEHQSFAEENARRPNKLRPAIPEKLITEARKLGVISHGNAGPGNTTLDGARQDAIATAFLVYEMCLDGRLGR